MQTLTEHKECRGTQTSEQPIHHEIMWDHVLQFFIVIPIFDLILPHALSHRPSS